MAPCMRGSLLQGRPLHRHSRCPQQALQQPPWVLPPCQGPYEQGACTVLMKQVCGMQHRSWVPLATGTHAGWQQFQTYDFKRMTQCSQLSFSVHQYFTSCSWKR
jgi:hypothetical protein